MKAHRMVAWLLGAILAAAALDLFPYPRAGMIAGGLILLTVGVAFAWCPQPHDLICRLMGLEWDRQAFCRGWFIPGAT